MVSVNSDVAMAYSLVIDRQTQFTCPNCRIVSIRSKMMDKHKYTFFINVGIRTEEYIVLSFVLSDF